MKTVAVVLIAAVFVGQSAAAAVLGNIYSKLNISYQQDFRAQLNGQG